MCPPSVPRPKYSLLRAGSSGSRLTGASMARWRTGASRRGPVGRLPRLVARRLAGTSSSSPAMTAPPNLLAGCQQMGSGRRGKEVPHLARSARRRKGPEERAPRLLLQDRRREQTRLSFDARETAAEDRDLHKLHLWIRVGLGWAGPCKTQLQTIKNIDLLN
jgi:hypothetical protein